MKTSVSDLSLTRKRSKPRRVLLTLACISYLFIHAIVPAGFMPASSDSGLAYEYCHGDLKSAELLRRLTASSSTDAGGHAQHHHHHHGDSEPLDGFVDTAAHVGEHCVFAAFAPVAVDVETELFAISQAFFAMPVLAERNDFRSSLLRNTIQARAPPAYT